MGRRQLHSQAQYYIDISVHFICLAGNGNWKLLHTHEIQTRKAARVV